MEIIDICDQEHLQELSTNSKFIKVIYFYTEGSAECSQMTDVANELSNNAEYKDVSFLKVNANKLEDITKKYRIQSVPSFVFCIDGTDADRLVGADVPALLKKLSDQMAKMQQPNNQSPEKELHDQLEKLINKAPCMLFMKGSKDAPRCGFSKQVIALLSKHNAIYETFDILEDTEVREGLKIFSNWPTYPQLYVNGELLGGLDILKEMSENGDLDGLLPTETEDLDKRLKGLIQRSPVMVFMKGCPETPRCGFSKNLVAMLNETGVKYDTFDILEDNAVREGLKAYSNWPTYPQVYVNGDLIGGFDIIKELHESNDLKATLEEK